MQLSLPYRLGLPAWAFPGWRGRYFLAQPSPLASYASVFNAVEGNTTFYQIPAPATISSWARALQGQDFHISFKLPRSVTHERRPSMADLETFLQVTSPLAGNLGPFLLQFPAWAGPDHLQRLQSHFEKVASAGTAVVEVRNPIFFNDPTTLEPVLQEFCFGRVMLDSRALYQGDISHPDVLAAIHEKPDVPVLKTLYNGQAFIRLILHPEGASNQPWIKDWASFTAGLIRQGLQPYMMIHCPNNQYCPAFAEDFHRQLASELAAPHAGEVSITLPDLAPWPVPQQGSLL